MRVRLLSLPHKIFSLELQTNVLNGRRHSEVRVCTCVRLEVGAHYVACTRSPGCSLLTFLVCVAACHQRATTPTHQRTFSLTNVPLPPNDRRRYLIFRARLVSGNEWREPILSLPRDLLSDDRYRRSFFVDVECYEYLRRSRQTHSIFLPTLSLSLAISPKRAVFSSSRVSKREKSRGRRRVYT